METQEGKQIISDSKNIYLIPGQELEAITSALALFYTLKELNKNVNLIIDTLPDSLNFLTPSLDFISYPKNFVISIPENTAKVSQIYYEKNQEALKIHLTVEGGIIKKENISFYFSEAKPDLIITIGIKDYSQELSGKLDSFGFLLDSPILNIDTTNVSQNGAQENKKFGKINLVTDSPLVQTAFSLIKDLNNNLIGKEKATCLLSGLLLHTQDFKKNLSAETFQAASELMKAGADLEKIKNHIKF